MGWQCLDLVIGVNQGWDVFREGAAERDLVEVG
jgi:hypothetical protein